jgi:hypothetical protein
MTGPDDEYADPPAVDESADAALLAELAGVLRARTGPPAEVVAAARELFTWRTIDAELAALAYDSLVDDGPALVRAANGPRILTFEAGEVVLEVEVDASPGARRFLGQVVPAQGADIELRSGDAPVTVRADGLGRFTLPLPAQPQPVKLRCRLDDGVQVESEWTVV